MTRLNAEQQASARREAIRLFDAQNILVLCKFLRNVPKQQKRQFDDLLNIINYVGQMSMLEQATSGTNLLRSYVDNWLQMVDIASVEHLPELAKDFSEKLKSIVNVIDEESSGAQASTSLVKSAITLPESE